MIRAMRGATATGTAIRSRIRNSPALAKVAGVVKWIVFVVVAILIVFGLFFGVLKYLAPFTDWARRWLDGIRQWWASLFGKEKTNPGRKSVSEAAPLAPRASAAVSCLLESIRGRQPRMRDPAELIAYTFEALDAWAWDRDAGREPPETPLEFTGRLGEAFPEQADIFAGLAQAVHANGLLGSTSPGRYPHAPGGSLGADGPRRAASV